MRGTDTSALSDVLDEGLDHARLVGRALDLVDIRSFPGEEREVAEA